MKEKAVEMFDYLDKLRWPGDEEPLIPVFDVRLDATTNRDDRRVYRVRVSPGPDTPSPDHWSEVVLMARESDEYGVSGLRIDNNGIELTFERVT